MTALAWNEAHPELPAMIEGAGQCEGCGHPAERLFEMRLPVGDGLERDTINACADCAGIDEDDLEVAEHDEGCCLHHDPGDGECATAEEMRDEMLLQRWEAEMDDAGRSR